MNYTFPKKTLTLNQQQTNIVLHDPNTNVRVLAAAGSGKTTTITAKIAHMIHTLHINSASILLVTFTHNAASAMSTKIADLIGSNNVLTGTFHSISQTILSQYTDLDPDNLYHVDELPHMFLEFIMGATGSVWASTIKYVFVDEYQDVNDIQYRTILALRRAGANVIIVGDDAQNIYAWRGSSVEYILRFETGFSPLVDFQLSTNYRSVASIINCANDAMKHIPTLSHKDMMRCGIDTVGVVPTVQHFKRFGDECKWVFGAACAAVASGTTAILSKFNSTLYKYEEIFAKAGVPCKLLTRRMDGVMVSLRAADLSAAPPDGTIVLSTFHASKGLEWDNVIMTGMCDDFFPQSKKPGEIIHERRLFYVGITRARQHLHFTYSGEFSRPSRFLTEIAALDGKRPAICELSTLDNTTAIKNGVTELIRNLNGEDYIHIKRTKMLPPLKFIQHSFYDGFNFTYPQWVQEHEMFSEFGCFIDYCIRRMIGEKCPPSGGLHDRRATDVISLGKVPDFMKKRFVLAYTDYSCQDKKWSTILPQIWCVSCCHSIWYGRMAVLYKKVSYENLLECMRFLLTIESVVDNLLSTPKYSTLICNPSFTNGVICGDIDLLAGSSGDTIIDIKTSANSPKQLDNILQLLCYVHLARSAGYSPANIVLFNPLSGEWLTLDVSCWDKGDELQEYLISRKK